jgi:peptidoglycan/LPS O-acetylase OafA/YrhL
MTEPTPTPPTRPKAVTVAFWCWVVSAVLLIVGGMLTAAAELPTLYRGGGVITGLAGAGMAFAAGRTRLGDNRFRRAATALSLAIVVIVAIIALVGVEHLLTLVALLPLIAGTVSISRPAADKWFDGPAAG